MRHNFERERRKQRRFEQIGTDKPRCPNCGEADWRCFLATTMPRCANCAIKATKPDDPVAKRRRLKELGSDRPRCGLCGETDWRCIEQHHFAGRRHDPTIVLLCANDHLRVTDDQRDHPNSDLCGDAHLERIAHGMLGLADMLRVIVEWLVEMGHALLERAQTQNSQTKRSAS